MIQNFIESFTDPLPEKDDPELAEMIYSTYL